MISVHDFSARRLDGREESLIRYRGKALLVVNVASRCGFTPQYAGLEALYREYASRGFAVLGFPCNQFAHQEPGNASEIERFCRENYGADFPMFAKIEVNGRHAHPLYRHLKMAAPGLLGSRAITKPNAGRMTLSGFEPGRIQGAEPQEGSFPFKAAQRSRRPGSEPPEREPRSGPPPALCPLAVGVLLRRDHALPANHCEALSATLPAFGLVSGTSPSFSSMAKAAW